jgi:predicted transcriptional regulator
MTTQIHTTPRLLNLIDQASMRAGNDNKLAKMLATTRQAISQYRAGKRSCPLEDQALMAAIIDSDPLKEVADAMIERHANTPRGEKLVSALGKGLMSASGAALITVSASDVSASSSIVAVELLRCILC